MSQHQHDHQHSEHSGTPRTHCCPCGHGTDASGVSRRNFLGGMSAAAALGSVTLGGLSWSALAATGPEVRPAPPRRPLVIKPVLIYATYKPAKQTSWRSWGGIQTQQDVDQELVRIKGELEKLGARVDFPVQFLPVAAVQNANELAKHADVATADVLLVYAAGGWVEGLEKYG